MALILLWNQLHQFARQVLTNRLINLFTTGGRNLRQGGVLEMSAYFVGDCFHYSFLPTLPILFLTKMTHELQVNEERLRMTGWGLNNLQLHFDDFKAETKPLIDLAMGDWYTLPQIF